MPRSSLLTRLQMTVVLASGKSPQAVMTNGLLSMIFRAHTVYMPDGTQIEAHSGLGTLLDDPSHADEKMRGVTPPNVYDLELREELFHGVRALRLIPQDERKVFGRAGLLAHSFMLGPNGDSNGCVSFRNYDAFLQAYLNQKVKRLPWWRVWSDEPPSSRISCGMPAVTS